MNQFGEQWRASKKVVYSTSLTEPTTTNTTIECTFDLEKARTMLTESDKDFGIGGPNLAAEAIRAGMVDEFHQIIAPVIVGGGTQWLPKDVEIELKLVKVHTFKNGFVHTQYNKA